MVLGLLPNWGFGGSLMIVFLRVVYHLDLMLMIT